MPDGHAVRFTLRQSVQFAKSMRMKILQVGEAVLRRPAKAVTARELRSREIQDLIDSMRDAMYEAPGIGLAAPQIGISLQIAVIHDKPEYTASALPEFLAARERRPVPFHVIVNPKISFGNGRRLEFFEGCLSLAGFTAVVPRAYEVTVECLDETGDPKVIQASGWYARILQHEIDHLQGKLYIDPMHSQTFMTVDNFNLLWKDKPMEEVLELCGFKR